MQRNIEDLTSELIRLPNRERLEIVRFLLFLDNHSSDSLESDAEWEIEIKNRIHAVDQGKAVGIDFDEAMKKIDKLFAS